MVADERNEVESNETEPSSRRKYRSHAPGKLEDGENRDEARAVDAEAVEARGTAHDGCERDPPGIPMCAQIALRPGIDLKHTGS